MMESSNQEVWIGVDVGTTGVRAIAYTEDGQMCVRRKPFIRS